MKIISILILAIVLIVSCIYFFCSELKGEWKEKYDNAKNKYFKVASLENIPCEFIYIDPKMKTSKIDTGLINALHKEIYDKENRVGWVTIKVYDNKGRYVFSHEYNNNIYYQTGD